MTRRSAAIFTFLVLALTSGARSQDARPWETWQPPAYTPPQPNGYDDLVAAAALIEQFGAVDPNAPLEDQQRLVQQLQPVFAHAALGLHRDCLAPEVRSYNQEVKYLSGLRNLARAYVVRATVQAAEGDRAAAVQSDLDAYALGATVPRGGMLIHHLVGIACQAIATRDLSRRVNTLARQDAAPALERLLALSAKPYPYTLTVEGERTVALQSLKARAPVAADPLAVAVFEATNWTPLLKTYAQALTQAQRPWPQRGTIEPNGGVFDEALRPLFERTFTKVTQGEAETRLLTVKLALWLYYCDHGAFPQELNALTPTYLTAVPLDPFADRALRYRVKERTCLVWSIAEDEADQEGQPKKPGVGEPGDLVEELTY